MRPDLWMVVDHAAQDTARKGLDGNVGDPLPLNMTLESVMWINSNQAQFMIMVANWKHILGR